MTDSKNPYAIEPAKQPVVDQALLLANELQYVKQVQIVAILQIVLGVLELVMGGVLLCTAVFFPFIMSQAAEQSGESVDENMVTFLTIYYAAAGGLTVLFSILRIIAGMGAFAFRWRMLLIASLVCGAASMLTCYCAPFSLAVGIYGLIVAFQPSVAKAFRFAKEGASAAEIKKRFHDAAYSSQATASDPSSMPSA